MENDQIINSNIIKCIFDHLPMIPRNLTQSSPSTFNVLINHSTFIILSTNHKRLHVKDFTY